MPEVDRAAALARWLRPHLGEVSVSGLGRAGAGNSNETVLFTAGDRRLVVRLQPGGDSLFLRPSVAREAMVLQAVESAGTVPVPHVIGVEEDPAVLGTPFFVMEAIDGRVLIDMPTYHRAGWLKDSPPELRARHWETGMAAMAAIATLPPEPFAFLGDGLAGLVRDVREWFDWAAHGRDVGILGVAMDHLEATMPERDDAVLSWGDSRPGNIIYTPHGDVAAVLDWEMASLAPAETDLGWWVMMEEFYSSRAGSPLLEGTWDEATAVARWESLIGRSARDLPWFKILAAVRMGIVMLRSRDANVAAGILPDDATTHSHNPISQMLASWLGLPEPELSPHFLILMKHFKDQKVARSSS